MELYFKTKGTNMLWSKNTMSTVEFIQLTGFPVLPGRPGAPTCPGEPCIRINQVR